MGKHLIDETAEFKMPRIARHAAEHEDELEPTQRFDTGFTEKGQQPEPWETDER